MAQAEVEAQMQGQKPTQMQAVLQQQVPAQIQQAIIQKLAEVAQQQLQPAPQILVAQIQPMMEQNIQQNMLEAAAQYRQELGDGECPLAKMRQQGRIPYHPRMFEGFNPQTPIYNIQSAAVELREQLQRLGIPAQVYVEPTPAIPQSKLVAYLFASNYNFNALPRFVQGHRVHYVQSHSNVLTEQDVWY